jgi:hypothetical protein
MYLNRPKLLFLFLKGMSCALAPFSYLVVLYNDELALTGVDLIIILFCK